MSTDTVEEQVPAKQDPEALVLRGRPRPVARFRRGLIVGVSGAIALTLVLLSWLALEPRTFRTVAEDSSGAEPSASDAAQTLAQAPRSYSEVPRLGAPLPGDLGRPILERQRSLEAKTMATPGFTDTVRARSADGEARDREAARKDAALISPVLVSLHGADARAPVERSPEQAIAASAEDQAAASLVTTVGHEQSVALARATGGDTNESSVHAAFPAMTLAAGTIIPASLLTGVNSDLPGIVIAQVTDNVRDSATGTRVLVPQGARLIGRYDSLVAFGQRRALLVWTRIVFPDASSVDLDKVPATDVSGYSGLRDRVDAHGWELIKGIALSTLLGVGTELGIQNSASDLARAIRESAQQSSANAGAQITGHELARQPTITIRPGWPVRAILNTDLTLQPWKE